MQDVPWGGRHPRSKDWHTTCPARAAVSRGRLCHGSSGGRQGREGGKEDGRGGRTWGNLSLCSGKTSAPQNNKTWKAANNAARSLRFKAGGGVGDRLPVQDQSGARGTGGELRGLVS